MRAAMRRLWPALAASLLVPLVGLFVMAAVPVSEPDAAMRARVQAWRDMPPPVRPAPR